MSKKHPIAGDVWKDSAGVMYSIVELRNLSGDWYVLDVVVYEWWHSDGVLHVMSASDFKQKFMFVSSEDEAYIGEFKL